MIVDLLIINNNTELVDIHPAIRTLEPYCKLFDESKRSKVDFKLSKKILAYIFHMTDIRSNIYRAYPTTPKDRHLACIDRLNLPKNFVPDGVVQECIEAYSNDIQTVYDEILTSALKSVLRLQQYFDTVEFTNPKFDFKTYASAISNLRSMIQGIEELKKDIEKDTIEKLKIKGGNDVGFFEDADE